MTAATFFDLLLTGGLFMSVLALGSSATAANVAYLWRRPSLLARSFLTMYVVMPVVTLVLLAVMPLPRPTQVALVLLAVAPGLPTSPKNMLMLGANPPYVYSLLVSTSLLAVFTVPVSLSILSAVFSEEASIRPLQVLNVLAPSFLVPLALGIALGRWAPATAPRIGAVSGKIGGAALTIWWVALLFLNFDAVLRLGLFSLGALALWVIVGLTVGHLLGGPDPVNRPSLAIVTALRHIGVAALIATTSFADAKPLPMILAYVTAYILVPIPYSIWWKKRTAARPVEPKRETDEGTHAKNPPTATETKS